MSTISKSCLPLAGFQDLALGTVYDRQAPSYPLTVTIDEPAGFSQSRRPKSIQVVRIDPTKGARWLLSRPPSSGRGPAVEVTVSYHPRCLAQLDGRRLAARICQAGVRRLLEVPSARIWVSAGQCPHRALGVVFGEDKADQVLVNFNTILAELAAFNRNNQETTVLFADIRSFTSLSESMSPEKVIDILNDHFDAMVAIVFKYHGVLDKFVGDELMAVFGLMGSPQQKLRHAKPFLI